jgi:DNA-binding Xre family transcriptional regulator
MIDWQETNKLRRSMSRYFVAYARHVLGTLGMEGASMIRFRLAEVMADHNFRNGTRVEWKDVAAATGVHRSTLSKMLNVRGYNASVDSIDRLCTFFQCRVEDLLVHVPESAPGRDTE